MLELPTDLWDPADAGDEPADVATFAMVGSAPGVRMLVPLANRRVAAESMRRGSDHVVTADIVRRAAATAGLRTGAAWPALRRRSCVRVRSGADEDATLHEMLAAVLDLARVEVAVQFGPDKPNMKPILRVMTPAGATVAWVKLGWNPSTVDLVDREAETLRSLAGTSLPGVTIPDVLHVGSWRGHRIVVLGPLDGPQRIRRGPGPTGDMFAAVARADGLTWQRLSTSNYLGSLRTAIAGLGPAERRTAAASLDSIVARWGDVELPFGRWHGDWTPWNMVRHGDGIGLWDWERSERDVPLGFDPVHYHHQVHLVRAPSDGASSNGLAAAMTAARPALRHLGITEAEEPVVAGCYLLTMYLRFAQSLDAGDPAADALVARTGAALSRAVAAT